MYTNEGSVNSVHNESSVDNVDRDMRDLVDFVIKESNKGKSYFYSKDLSYSGFEMFCNSLSAISSSGTGVLYKAAYKTAEAAFLDNKPLSETEILHVIVSSYYPSFSVVTEGDFRETNILDFAYFLYRNVDRKYFLPMLQEYNYDKNYFSLLVDNNTFEVFCENQESGLENNLLDSFLPCLHLQTDFDIKISLTGYNFHKKPEGITAKNIIIGSTKFLESKL